MSLLAYPFFQHALLGALLASIVCGIVGTYIVTRRLVFISGGLTHASFGGVGIALYLGVPPIFSASLFAILSAFGVQWLSQQREVREDSAIAVFWALGMAVGIIFTYLAPGYATDLSAYLFGNILTITAADLWFLAAVTLVVSLLFLARLNLIRSVAFDRDFALSRRLPVTLIEYTLMACIALTIVACLRLVGIVLVISLLTIPQMTANLFTHRYTLIVWLSIAVGLVSCLGGLVLAYSLDVPSGACIIFTNILIYFLSRLYKSYISYKSHKTSL